MSGSSLHSPLSAALALVLGALSCGCAARGEPLGSPELITFVSYYGGDPVGGPIAEGAAISLKPRKEDSIQVSVELRLVSTTVPEAAEPLPQHVRLILGSEGPEPIGTHPTVLRGARLLVGDEGASVAKSLVALPADKGVRMVRFEGLSMPGIATRMSSTFAQGASFHDDQLVDRHFGVELWQDSALPGGLSVALSTRDLIEAVRTDRVSGELQLTQVQTEEVLILDTLLPLDGSPLVIMTEPAFDLEADARVALILKARPMKGAEPGLEARLKTIGAEVRDAALEGTRRRQQLRLREREVIRFQESIDALPNPSTRRAALLDLASSSKCELAIEFALLADEGLLEAFTSGLVADREVLRALASDKADLAWRLEREVLIELLDGVEAGSLGQEYMALLLQFTGDAGRQLGVVQDAIVASTSIASFRIRLIEENKIALESSSPSARLRAADWLATQSVTVPGYDPLGPARERRQALREWAAAAAKGPPKPMPSDAAVPDAGEGPR